MFGNCVLVFGANLAHTWLFIGGVVTTATVVVLGQTGANYENPLVVCIGATF